MKVMLGSGVGSGKHPGKRLRGPNLGTAHLELSCMWRKYQIKE